MDFPAVFKGESPAAVSVVGEVINDLPGSFPTDDRRVGDRGSVDAVVDLPARIDDHDGCRKCGKGDGKEERVKLDHGMKGLVSSKMATLQNMESQ